MLKDRLIIAICFIVIIILATIASKKQLQVDRLDGELLLAKAVNIELERELETYKADIEVLDENIDSLEASYKDIREELDLAREDIKSLRETKPIQTSRGAGIGKWREFTATGYCPCKKCNGRWAGQATASGKMPKAKHTIAVDPKVISLGTKVEIEGLGVYTAEDTGGAIKGDIIDIYFNTHQEALEWGRRKVRIRW